MVTLVYDLPFTMITNKVLYLQIYVVKGGVCDQVLLLCFTNCRRPPH